MMKQKRARQSVLWLHARERHAKKTELFTLRIEPRLLEELWLLSDEHFSVARHVRIAIQEYLSIRRDAIDRAREERKKSQCEDYVLQDKKSHIVEELSHQ
jgi:hypothetical protein